jgi:hypothetical protein
MITDRVSSPIPTAVTGTIGGQSVVIWKRKEFFIAHPTMTMRRTRPAKSANPLPVAKLLLLGRFTLVFATTVPLPSAGQMNTPCHTLTRLTHEVSASP